MLRAANKVSERWPDATIEGFYGNATVILDIVSDGLIVGYVNLANGDVRDLHPPLLHPRWSASAERGRR